MRTSFKGVYSSRNIPQSLCCPNFVTSPTSVLDAHLEVMKELKGQPECCLDLTFMYTAFALDTTVYAAGVPRWQQNPILIHKSYHNQKFIQCTPLPFFVFSPLLWIRTGKENDRILIVEQKPSMALHFVRPPCCRKWFVRLLATSKRYWLTWG